MSFPYIDFLSAIVKSGFLFLLTSIKDGGGVKGYGGYCDIDKTLLMSLL
jgi:hypothetical protein